MRLYVYRCPSCGNGVYLLNENAEAWCGKCNKSLTCLGERLIKASA